MSQQSVQNGTVGTIASSGDHCPFPSTEVCVQLVEDEDNDLEEEEEGLNSSTTGPVTDILKISSSPLPPSTSSAVSVRSVFQASKTLLERTTILVGGLSFSVGWANAVSFEYYRAYATMMTGNWINFGFAVGEGRGWDALFYLVVIACFVSGHSMYRFVSSPHLFPRFCRHSSSALSPFILILCIIQDMWLNFGPIDQARYVITLLALALGMVTSAASVINGVTCNMFTGHTTQITDAVCDALFLEAPLSNKKKKTAFRSVILILIFLSGVIWGTILKRWVYTSLPEDAFNPVFTPLGVIMAVLMCMHDFQVSHGSVESADLVRRHLSTLLGSAE